MTIRLIPSRPGGDVVGCMRVPWKLKLVFGNDTSSIV